MTIDALETGVPSGAPSDGRRPLRFIIIGGVNTVFGLAVYPALLFGLAPLHLHYMAALLIAQLLSLVFAYTTQKLFVFRTRGDLVREFIKFSSFYLGIYAVNWAALPALVELAGIKPWLAQIGFVVVTVFGSYFFHSRLTFRGKNAGA